MIEGKLFLDIFIINLINFTKIIFKLSEWLLKKRLKNLLIYFNRKVYSLMTLILF